MTTVDIIQDDCINYFAHIRNDQFDATITDPPYGINENHKKNESRGNRIGVKDYGEYDWDKERVPSAYIHEILRISKQQVIFGGNYYADLLPPSSSWIVWDKLNSGDFADCELAWTSHKKAVRKFTYCWNGFIKQHPEERFHPTQKPLSLMVWILENYTSVGDTIIDPFAGSGTTGVAAIITGRNAVLIEKDSNNCDIIRRRIGYAQQQQPLFTL